MGTLRHFRRHLLTQLAMCALVMGLTALGRAGEEPVPEQKPQPRPDEDADVKLNPNFSTLTLGGRQFWADVEFFHQWRIQQNTMTGHFRLLDADDYRHAWGTREQCQAKLREFRTAQKLPPMKGEAVILVHGIIRSSKSMSRMRQELERAGYAVFAVDYPSTRVEIPQSAKYLHSVIDSLEGIEKIHFVTHSMGGLVVRSYLDEHRDPRIGRMVMIATPNLGAHMADMLHTNVVYRLAFGPAGQQLTSDAAGLIAGLSTPDFEFAVIAGGRGTLDGYNPLIPGDDDGTVSVASTRLPGASDFAVVHSLHTFVISAPETLDYTVRFLKEGRLRSKGDRQPIPIRDAAAEGK